MKSDSTNKKPAPLEAGTNQLVTVFSPESNGFVVVQEKDTIPQPSLDGGAITLEHAHPN